MVFHNKVLSESPAQSTNHRQVCGCWRYSLPGTWLEAKQGDRSPDAKYPIQKVTEIYKKVTEAYKKVTEAYKKVTELVNSSWNVLSLLRSEVAYIGTGHILPLKLSFVFLIIGVSRA
jgi:hypothetical protein